MFITERPWILLLVALPAIAWLTTRLSFINQMRQFKGHWTCRLTSLPFSQALLREDVANWLLEQSKTYGPLVQVSPKILATSSPEVWEQINKRPGWRKSPWFYRAARFDWRDDNLFNLLDIDEHDERRKQMLPAYNGRENLTLESDIDACVRQLIHLIRTGYADARTPMDLAQKLQYLTLDVICTVGWGRSLGLLGRDGDPDGCLAAIAGGLRMMNAQMALGTWWLSSMPVFGMKVNPDVETARGFDKILALSWSMVDAREAAFREAAAPGKEAEHSTGGDREDMLASFMRNGLAGSRLKTEVILQFVAGSDTTAGTLRGTMLYVLTNPRVYKALQAEIDEAVRAGKAPRPPGIIGHAQARQLPYLQAVIREGLRVFPAANNPLSRDVPPGGDTIVVEGEEVYLPGGIAVVPSFTAMGRDRGVYGDDADVFRPERWLEGDEGRLADMKHANDGSFGHGRWACPGRQIAVSEASKVFFELFRNFDWGLTEPEKPWRNASLMGLRSISDFWVSVKDRV
ncbi:cytochrome P450 [Xylariaceae sp. FL0016]|nr:cytochrome P450 [Xylariaceae sp. FL0016]